MKVLEIIKTLYVEILTYTIVFVIGIGLGMAIWDNFVEGREDEQEIHQADEHQKADKKR